MRGFASGAIQARLVWTVAHQSMYGILHAAVNFAAIVMDTLDANMKFQVWRSNSCLCKFANKDLRLFCHGDDLVILADDNGTPGQT